MWAKGRGDLAQLQEDYVSSFEGERQLCPYEGSVLGQVQTIWQGRVYARVGLILGKGPFHSSIEENWDILNLEVGIHHASSLAIVEAYVPNHSEGSPYQKGKRKVLRCQLPLERVLKEPYTK